jgi:hypothetical protein
MNLVGTLYEGFYVYLGSNEKAERWFRTEAEAEKYADALAKRNNNPRIVSAYTVHSKKP